MLLTTIDGRTSYLAQCSSGSNNIIMSPQSHIMQHLFCIANKYFCPRDTWTEMYTGCVRRVLPPGESR